MKIEKMSWLQREFRIDPKGKLVFLNKFGVPIVEVDYTPKLFDRILASEGIENPWR